MNNKEQRLSKVERKDGITIRPSLPQKCPSSEEFKYRKPNETLQDYEADVTGLALLSCHKAADILEQLSTDKSADGIHILGKRTQMLCQEGVARKTIDTVERNMKESVEVVTTTGQ